MTSQLLMTRLTLLPVLLLCAVIGRAAEGAGPLVIADFESTAELAQWSGLPVEQTAVRASSGRCAMRFMVPQYRQGEAERPGVSLQIGPKDKGVDWSHYGKLIVDAWVEGDQPGRLGLKLRDVRGRSSWTTHLTVEPGKLNQAELLISDAAADSDVTRLAEVVLYALRPTNSYTLIVDNLRLLPADKPPLAQFHLRYPNYRGLIFPAARQVEVLVEVACGQYGLKPSELCLRVSLDGGPRAVAKQARLVDKSGRMELSAARLRPGPATLRASLRKAQGDVELASQKWPLRKLSRTEAERLKVYVDQHNNLIVDGKPFFPLGWYGSVNEQHLLELADSPFNCLLAYGTDQVPRDKMLSFLDLMHRHGMKLVYCMNDVYPTATYFAGKSWEGIAGNQAIAEAVVRAYREHPAILGWYLNDELPRELLPSLKDYYQRARDLDPNHPCLIVLCNRRDFPLFPPTTDILGVDPYPIPREPVTLVSEFADAANNAVRGAQPVWLVPQAFAWYQYNSKNPDRGHIPGANELATGRAPTFDEARCMTYLALTHGAKGLLYYCYYDLRMLPQYGQMWAWMQQIAAEVKSLSPVLLAPDEPTPPLTHPPDAPIHLRLKQFDGRLYLLAVNSATNAYDVELSLRRRLPSRLKVWFEDREVPAKTTGFTDHFAPLAAHVYEITGAGPLR
jgi:hypothetical protein